MIVVYCDTDERWASLEQLSTDGQLVVAIVVEFSVDVCATALAAGAAGVCAHDTSAAIILSVIEGVARGETTLPVFAAQALASSWVGNPPPDALSSYEISLRQALSDGARMCELADALGYSERTIRRHLQSIYLKLGATNRIEALRLALRSGVI